MAIPQKDMEQLETVHVNGVKGYTTYGVAGLMGGVTRQAVHDYAARHNWRALGQVGRVTVWSARDVERTLRSHTPRAKTQPEMALTPYSPQPF